MCIRDRFSYYNYVRSKIWDSFDYKTNNSYDYNKKYITLLYVYLNTKVCGSNLFCSVVKRVSKVRIQTTGYILC